MAKWLIERGIGETRYARIADGEIAEARVLLDGVVPAGTSMRAQLKRVARPTIAASGGVEYLMPNGAAGLTEGLPLTIEVTREALPGVEPWKRPLARVVEGEPQPAELPKGEQLPFPSPDDRLGAVGWHGLLDEARSGIVDFPGGALRISATPAMTLIDVDGTLPPVELAMAGARAAARAIGRHGIGGSIGVDFPTVKGKAERQAIAEALDSGLPKPFERTAVNGFGFLQIVRPRPHASLVELAQDRPGFEARALLRQATVESAGAKRLVAHPAVIGVVQSNAHWLDALARQLGGAVSLRSDPSLPMSGGYAEPA
ncbi:MAG: ribonuclease [Sphingomicrobium sp.]